MEVGGVSGIMGSTYVIVMVWKRGCGLCLTDRAVQEVGGACIVLGRVSCIVGSASVEVVMCRRSCLYMIGRAWVTSVVRR